MGNITSRSCKQASPFRLPEKDKRRFRRRNSKKFSKSISRFRGWVFMEKVCCVIAGKWEYVLNGSWEFKPDKERMGRLVNIVETFSLDDLCIAVGIAFGDEKKQMTLSYWNASYGRSNQMFKMTPLMIENDTGVSNFFKILMDCSESNLLVTFIDEVVSFKTPVSEVGKRRSVFEGESSNSDCYTLEPRRKIAKSDIVVDEDGLLEEVEAMEEIIRSNGKGSATREPSRSVVNNSSMEPNWNLLDDDEMSDSEEIAYSESDVRSGGYDTDFWEPLVDDMYGGSNAVEVMCSTNSVFDHMVRLGGDGEREQYAKVEDYLPQRNTNLGQPNSGIGGSGNANWFSNSARSHSQTRGNGTGTPNPNSGCRGNDFPCASNPVFGRNLKDVRDEEFDLDPLFDDTTYEYNEIPDLDRDDLDDDIVVGKTYRSKLDCQISLAIYAIKNMFYFRQTRSHREYIVLNCADAKCGWRVTAYQMKDCGYFQIRKASLEHICSIETRSQYYKLVSSKVIAAIYRSKFSDKGSGPRPMDLQQLLLEDLRVSSSYTKCWKARESATAVNQGSEEEAYLNLPQYLHMLKIANPGTIADLETEEDGKGGERFLYLFLSFGASIVGFRNVRRVIVLDGTHLGGKYKGVLLTASGQDGNFQIFPLAFAIVDSENDASWHWFLTKIQGIIADSPSLTFISDRAKSILKAVKVVFKQAHHGACVVHLSRNVVSKFKSKGLAHLVTQAACAYKVGQFRALYGEICKRSNECGKYLQTGGLGSWSRVYFKGERYNLMTSNLAESLNNALRKGRNCPITELVMFIQSLLTRWFSARRSKALTHSGNVTPQVDKVLTNNLSHAKGSSVISICQWRYEVKGQFGERHTVDLKDKKCTCKYYDELKIPCGHALLACGVMGLSYGQACVDYYRTSTWKKTYEGVVQPHHHPIDADIPEDVMNRVIGPPKTRRPAGRPKQRRIPSIGEISSGSSNQPSMNRCGRCKGIGHNRSSCKNPI